MTDKDGKIIAWAFILGSIALSFSSNIRAEVYVPVTGAAVYYQKQMGDNNWYQDRWGHNLRWTSWAASLGVGKDFGKWSTEANYRYMNGGRLDAVLEYDTTYDCLCIHNPVEHTVTTWDVRGVSLDLIHHFDGPYFRAGIFYFKAETINHVEFWDSGKVTDVVHIQHKIEPLFGFGILSHGISLEYIFYPLVNAAENPVKSAHTLNLGYRF